MTRSAAGQVGRWRGRPGPWLVALAAAGLAVAAGCAASSPIGAFCQTGADCESGACDDGACVDAGSTTATAGTGTGTGTGTGGAGSTGSAGGGGEASGTGTGGAGVCQPDGDGTIERREVPLQAGLSAKFLAATDVTISTAGTMNGGERTWDLSVSLPGDHLSLLETLPLAGQWFEADFAAGTYAARLSEDSALYGVFEVTDAALLLLGVVSPSDGPTKTSLAYDPPVVVLSFPLEEQKTWSTDATVTGFAQGVYGVYYESYDTVVDARGDLVAPFGTFDALRTRVDLVRTVGALVTTQRTFAFVTECFGTVATMVSQPGESGGEFSDVAEIRRLSP